MPPGRRKTKAAAPPDSALRSAIAPRNFTVTVDERVRGLGGPPAYAARKRQIEGIEEELLQALREIVVPDDGSGLTWQDLLTTRMKNRFATLERLVEAHNRYYPIETNLPRDPTTGGMVDRSGSWPHARPSWTALFARGREEDNGEASGGG